LPQNGKIQDTKMKSIRKKLKKKNGATLVMALFYLMLCVAIGSMILSSGSTAMGQVHHLSAEEQSYLNVLSAAELIKSEMLGTSIVEKQLTTTTFPDVNAIQEPPPPPTYPDNALKDKLQAIYDGPTAEEVFTVEAGNLDLEDISVTLSMNEEYALKFVLTEQGGSLYTLTLLMPAEVNQTNETKVSVKEKEYPEGSGEIIIYTKTDFFTTKSAAYDLGSIYKGAR
jgi:hypothetical protein